jgi:hypothetical protein
VLFDLVRNALAKLRFREEIVDADGFVVVASRADPPGEGWVAKIYEDLGVVITNEDGGGSFLQCAAQSEHIRWPTEEDLIEGLFRVLNKLS